MRLADIAHLGEVGAAVQAKIDEVAVHKRQLTPQESATEYIRSRLRTTFPNHADLDVIIERAIQFWRAGGLRSVMVGPHPPGPPARTKPPFDHPRADEIDNMVWLGLMPD